MGMKALVVIEIKTRLIELRKELDEMIELFKKAEPTTQALHTLQLEEMQLRFKELEDDHDLMRLFDESEWGRFDQSLNAAIQKLSRDISVLRTDLEKTPMQAVPA